MTRILLKQSGCRPLKCLVLDGEAIAVTRIVNYINKLDFLDLEEVCSSTTEAAEILRKKNIDLMFLDISGPHLSEFEFLESLDKIPLTILTTVYADYAFEGFRLNVIDYLLKPVSFSCFSQVAMKAREMFLSHVLSQDKNERRRADVYVRQGDSFLRIMWENILYVEGMQNYLKLCFKDRSVIIHQTMTSLEEILPKEMFFRIHRSFLVNLSHIDSVSAGSVWVNGRELPVSKQRREDVLNTIVYTNLISK